MTQSIKTKHYKLETLSAEEMKNTPLEPLTNRRFIASLTGVDRFLVKSFKSWEEGNIATGESKKTIGMVFHAAIVPSTHQQIQEWIDRQKNKALVQTSFKVIENLSSFEEELLTKEEEIVVKQLDPVGTVVCLMVYQGVELTKLEWPQLTYDGSSCSEIKLTFSYKNHVVVY